MGKKSKKEKKRARRRERARNLEAAVTPDEQIESEDEADEAVRRADTAAPEEQPVRERRAPKPPREEQRDNAWEHLKAFLREVDIERKKINWPAIDETWRSTWVTIIVIVFLSGFMGLASWGFSQVSERLFGVQRTISAPPAANVPTSPLGGALNPAAPPPVEQPAGDEGGTEAPSGQ